MREDAGYVLAINIFKCHSERHLKMPSRCRNVMSNKYSPCSRKYLADAPFSAITTLSVRGADMQEHISGRTTG